jgi:hypothetical protein
MTHGIQNVRSSEEGLFHRTSVGVAKMNRLEGLLRPKSLQPVEQLPMRHEGEVSFAFEVIEKIGVNAQHL